MIDSSQIKSAESNTWRIRNPHFRPYNSPDECFCINRKSQCQQANTENLRRREFRDSNDFTIKKKSTKLSKLCTFVQDANAVAYSNNTLQVCYMLVCCALRALLLCRSMVFIRSYKSHCFYVLIDTANNR